MCVSPASSAADYLKGVRAKRVRQVLVSNSVHLVNSLCVTKILAQKKKSYTDFNLFSSK